MIRSFLSAFAVLLTASLFPGSPFAHGQADGLGPLDRALLFDPLFPLPPGGGRSPGQPPPPERNQGPWNQDVRVFRLNADGEVTQTAVFERAGVPTLARLADDRLIAAHQHFPADDPDAFDKVAVHFSSDDGLTWTEPQVITLKGLPEGMRFPFDPTLVPLPAGRVRMYFTSLLGRRFDEDLPRIHSAVSDDGVHYEYEPGVRFGIPGLVVIDCAVVLHRGVFHLYSPDNGEQPARPEGRSQAPQMRPRDGTGYHATSTDGLDFTRVDDVQIEGRRRWLGNAQSDGETITFFGTGDPDPGRGERGGVFMATSKDGQTWKLARSPGIGGADPGGVAGKDNGWIFAVTGLPARNESPVRRNRGE